MTALTAAILWSTIRNSQGQTEQDSDIKALEDWKRAVERQVDWLKLDHDEWAEQLQEANPQLVVPQDKNIDVHQR